MSYNFTIFSVLFLVTSIISFFGAFLAWQRRSIPGARELTWLMISSGIWSFWIIFETASLTADWKIFWAKLEYTGAVTTPILYLIFALHFTGRIKAISKKYILLLSILPLITLVLAFTNEKHLLIWSGFSAISGETNIMEYYHGAWYWIGYLAYNYLLLLFATYLLVSFIINHKKTFRKQGLIVYIAGFCPWIASVLYLTGLNPVTGLDLVPVSLILSGSLFVYAILYTRFLDLVPVARETLVETLPDGIIVIDGQHRIQDINGAAIGYLGIPGKNILGLPLEASNATSLHLLTAVLGTEPVRQIEINAENETKIFRINKQPIRNQPESQLVIIRDLTDQIEKQRKIKAGEQAYHAMFTMFRLMADNMSDMLWAKDLDNRYVFTNKAMCDNLLHAVDTNEPIGKTDMFFALRERAKHPERADWHTFGELCQESDSAVIRSGKPEQFDEYGNVNGKFIFLDTRKAPIFDEEGKMIGVVGSAHDITLQKKAELDIIKRDELLDAIAKATALLIQGENLEKSIHGALEIIGRATKVNRVYIFENHTDPHFKLPVMSQRHEWTNGSVEVFIDDPDLQNLPYESDLLRWYDTLSSGNVIVGNIGEFPESERNILEPQGIKSILVAPVLINKNFWGFVGFDDCESERAWPITEERILAAAANTIGAAYLRKKNQEELIIAKEKAEESDRLKSAFLANMSHEIRTPMNGIVGFAELLKEPELTGEEIQGYIQIIEKSSLRMLNIINNIVDISKIESGQMEVSLSKTNVNEQVEYIHKFFNPEVVAKGIQFSFDLSLPTNDADIISDREKIYAILTNLIKNAIKYTSAGKITFGYEKKGNFLEFFVSDTGIGVAKDRQAAIFERFIQADIIDKQAFQGAGLGLSITKAYVEMLGGKIWVESEPGNGSIFRFTIPYSPQSEVKPAEIETMNEEIRNSRQKNIKVLVVEDESNSALYIKLVLKKISREILLAKNGSEAVEICRNNPDTDLVLMDIKMPEMNGYEATRLIRQFNKEVIIIAQTAFGLTGDKEKALLTGCNDYLSKPVKIQQILAMIDKHFPH
ncbi:MAG: response regulator [Bacteroidales bacterium]|nr:response regulator [Bacteroidales bacterium]